MATITATMPTTIPTISPVPISLLLSTPTPVERGGCPWDVVCIDVPEPDEVVEAGVDEVSVEGLLCRVWETDGLLDVPMELLDNRATTSSLAEDVCGDNVASVIVTRCQPKSHREKVWRRAPGSGARLCTLLWTGAKA